MCSGGWLFQLPNPGFSVGQPSGFQCLVTEHINNTVYRTPKTSRTHGARGLPWLWSHFNHPPPQKHTSPHRNNYSPISNEIKSQHKHVAAMFRPARTRDARPIRRISYLSTCGLIWSVLTPMLGLLSRGSLKGKEKFVCDMCCLWINNRTSTNITTSNKVNESF